MAIAAAILILLLATPAVYAAEHTVGDNSGWTQGYDYTNWVSGKTFTVGDTLVFTYGGSHSVDVVSKSDYDNCATGNALQSYSDGNTKINLTSPGAMYFICPTLGHCSGGMKLAVTTVAASSGTTPSGTPPSSSGTPAADTPPSTTTTSPPPPPSAASATLCNMMLVIISLLGFSFMG